MIQPPIYLKSTFISQSEQVHQNEQITPDLLYHYMSMALEALAEHDLEIDDPYHFDTTISLGIKAVEIFFNGAHYEPSQDELDLYFQSFIRRSMARKAKIQ